MSRGLFAPDSRYRRPARWAAILWTIAIFVACLWPGHELPHSDIPFIDKWTHFVMFGVFSFLWLAAYPSGRLREISRYFWFSWIIGSIVEAAQIVFVRLGRSGDIVDAVADAVGGLLGATLFILGAKLSRGQKKPVSTDHF